MQRILINEGIKNSLANIITRSQDVSEENYRELIATLYSPGFFILKNSQGNLETDWKPEIVNDGNGNPTLLKINIKGKTPAKAYVNIGKIISLNDNYIFAPLSLRTITIGGGQVEDQEDNPPPNAPTDYTLYAIAKNSDKEPVDYLPNYIADGETKNFVREYLADFIAVSSGGRQVNVEGIKLCKFTVGTTGNLSNLLDLRILNRAYIKPELYDFFMAGYAKHDFVLTAVDPSSAVQYLEFGTNFYLKGSLVLVGGKSKTSKITVKFDDSPGRPQVLVPINSVIYITVTENEYFTSSVLDKELQVMPLADFSPSQDILVIGYHVTSKIPTTNEIGEAEE